MLNPLAADLDHVLRHTVDLWKELRGARIFITGGTGFFGCWMLESFVWACDSLNLDATMTVLTRSPEDFRAKAPHLARHRAISLLRGDVRSFEYPAAKFSHVVHAATEAPRKLCLEQPIEVLDSMIDGARHILDGAVAFGARRFLFTSSGAIYGPPPCGTIHLAETYRGAPNPADNHAVYGEGKRICELLCEIYRLRYGLECVTARGFSFVGPYMPMETYAIGNFILDTMRGKPIGIGGNGTPVRSYLYGADLAIWLWTILVRGEPGRPYNVGSEDGLSIAGAAAAVAAALNAQEPELACDLSATSPGNVYVPSTERARQELGLLQWIPLQDAIRRTAAWVQLAGKAADMREGTESPSQQHKSAGQATSCRACGGRFFPEPLLRYDDMPAGAQAFPERESLAHDITVDLELVECSGCGLMQLSNGPVPYYKNVVRASAISAEMVAFRQRQFRSFLERFSLCGEKVLEVGCGRGEFLSILRQSGADAYGVEFSQASVDHCVSKGLKVQKAFFPGDTASLCDTPFSAFLILNFLEHLPEPVEALKQIGAMLKVSGVGLVEVPNTARMLRGNIFSELVADHLLYFTRETLAKTLASSGFEVLECEEVWHEAIISATVRKRTRTDFSSFHESRARLESEIDEYLHRFGEGQVAVWGASHQALTILSMGKLGGRIRYVVDSAPFKQGKYTPASHIPIVSPDTLLSDPVDAVIVMAADYSDEVAAIIRSQFDPRLEVSVLRGNSLKMVPRCSEVPVGTSTGLSE